MKQLGWGWVFGFLLFSFFLPWSSIRAVFPLEKKKNQHMNLSIKPISNEFTAAPCMLDAPGQNRFLRKDKTKIGSSGPDWELSVFLLSKVLPLWSRTQGGHREIWHNRGISYNDSVTARCFRKKEAFWPFKGAVCPWGPPAEQAGVWCPLEKTNKQTNRWLLLSDQQSSALAGILWEWGCAVKEVWEVPRDPLSETVTVHNRCAKVLRSPGTKWPVHLCLSQVMWAQRLFPPQSIYQRVLEGW